jgi:hypothetical protein
MATLLAKGPRRRGTANGSTNVPKMKILNNHPDSASHRKNIVCIKEIAKKHQILKRISYCLQKNRQVFIYQTQYFVLKTKLN